MAFKDWQDLDQGEHLDLPIRGKAYRIPSPPARVGLRVQAFISTMMDAARAQENGQPIQLDEQVLDDANELDLYQDVLGPAYQQMVDDQVPIEALKHAAMTAMMWVAFDKTTAQAVWEGKAPTTAVRRSGGANMTRSRTPGSGTNRPQARRRNKGKGRQSGGGKSSPTGAS